MDILAKISKILSLMDHPAFFVRDGVVEAANDAALTRMIPLHQSVLPLLGSCRSDYLDFHGGSLSLPLTLGPKSFLASVERMEEGDLFLLSSEEEDQQLRSLALAAQQLRLPLNQALTAADDLFSRLAPGAADADTRQMESVNRSLYQILRLVLNMSDAHQDLSPRMELQDITAVLQEIFDQSAQLCEEMKVRLHFVNLPQSVYSLADSSRLERAVYNLLSNALRHVSAGSTVEAALTKRGSRLYLTVTDPGTASEAPLTGSAFHRFLREPGLDAGAGLGLGMRLIQSTAAAHGGTVLMEPLKPRGMRVTMSLAIRQDLDTLSEQRLRIDYAGERNHARIELSDLLPGSCYRPGNF